MRWKPLIIGAVIGAAAGFLMGGGKVSGTTNPLGITGKFAAPFQAKMDPGKGVRGG